MYFFFLGIVVSLAPSAILLGLMVWRAAIERSHQHQSGQAVPFPRIPT
jgi:hypothetical protein